MTAAPLRTLRHGPLLLCYVLLPWLGESAQSQCAEMVTEGDRTAHLVEPSLNESVAFTFRTRFDPENPALLPRDVTVYSLPNCLPASQILAAADDAARTDGWVPSPGNLPTADLPYEKLPAAAQQAVTEAFSQTLLPFARTIVQSRMRALLKPGMTSRLVVIRYQKSDDSDPGYDIADTAELPQHEDGSLVTINCALTESSDHSEGGTFFPANTSLGAEQHGDSTGLLLRPHAGTCLVHDGYVPHAGHGVSSARRVILVGFFFEEGAPAEERFDADEALHGASNRQWSSPIPSPTTRLRFPEDFDSAKTRCDAEPREECDA